MTLCYLRTLRTLRYLTLIALGVLLAACGSVPPSAERPEPFDGRPAASEKGNEVALFALGLIDTGYRFGGKNPDAGLDCSGMVSYIYERAAGMRLRGSAADIARQGRSIEAAKLRPGDLVFFNTRNAPHSHVGIYIGDNRFVHAPSRGGQVRVEQIDNRYWMRRFNGARRIAAADAPPDVLTSASFGRAPALEPAQFPGASPSARDAISPGATYY